MLNGGICMESVDEYMQRYGGIQRDQLCRSIRIMAIMACSYGDKLDDNSLAGRSIIFDAGKCSTRVKRDWNI
jgi:hypothetical protein